MKDLFEVTEEIQKVLKFEEGSPKEGTDDKTLKKWIKEAADEFDVEQDSFTKETIEVLVSLGIDMSDWQKKEKGDEDEAEVVGVDNLVDEIKAAGQMRELKIIAKDLDEFKSIRSELTKYKTLKDLREAMLGMLKEKPAASKLKVEKKPVEKKAPVVEKDVEKKQTETTSQKPKTGRTRAQIFAEIYHENKPRTTGELVAEMDNRYQKPGGATFVSIYISILKELGMLEKTKDGKFLKVQ